MGEVKIELQRNTKFLILGFILLFLIMTLITLLRTAWISDDAAITLRTVLNFTHDFGTTFNIDERVQAYTHPLWFLVISAITLLVENVFAADFIISISQWQR